jgi:hypothetical protein
MHEIYWKGQRGNFGFMNLSSLYSDHPYVWATHMSVFRVVSYPVILYTHTHTHIYIYIFVFLHLPHWRWTLEWPKHVRGHFMIKLRSQNRIAFVGLLIKLTRGCYFLKDNLREQLHWHSRPAHSSRAALWSPLVYDIICCTSEVGCFRSRFWVQ